MNETARALLVRYVDGNVTDAERQQVEADLAASEPMRKELAYLEAIRNVVAKRRARSPGLWDQIEEQIEAEAETSVVIAGFWSQFEWASKRLVPAFGAAAAVLLAVFGSLNGESDGQTVEDYLVAEWNTPAADVILSDDDPSADDVLYLTFSEL